MRATPFFLICLSLSAVQAASPPDERVLANIKRTLESRYPDQKVIDVRASPMPQLFEVYTGADVVYTDATGDFLLLGSLVDTRTMQDLTAARLDERGAIDFDSLPLELAIKTVRGDGSRTLAVFTDPDCPYCQAFERALAPITNVTVYTFLYPIEKLHPGVTEKARAIWCAKDASKAWSDWMFKKALPPQGSGCESNPISRLEALGESLYIRSTPTVFLANGKRVRGALETSAIEQLLDGPGGTKRASE